ncbi:MAG: hypothetical protein ABJB33_05840 [Gemmatimonadota bacterium]
MTTTYLLATDDPEMVRWLTLRLPEAFAGHSVAESTDGGVLITDLDSLRTLSEDQDGSITEDPEHGIQLWAEGYGYPLVPAERTGTGD